MVPSMKVGKAVKLDCSHLLIHNSANIVGTSIRGPTTVETGMSDAAAMAKSLIRFCLLASGRSGTDIVGRGVFIESYL